MAFSGIPLPKVVADVGPGGSIVTGMQGANALTQSNLENQIKRVQAQYAPLTTQAEAASKLAYANLMGPQFLAKLMGNQDILANIPDPQKRDILGRLQAAGTGQGTGAAIFGSNLNALNQRLNDQNQGVVNPISKILHHVVQSIYGGNDNESNVSSKQPNLSMQDQQGINNLQPRSSYVIQGNQQTNAPIPSPPPSSFASNVGSYKGIVEEGTEAGKIRANDIKDLNNTVFNAETKQATLDDINNMISSPPMREIRQLPLAGRHEIAYYSKFGTPEQQQLVGRIYAQLGNVVKDSSRDFAGQFRRGEQQLLTGMKPNDSDTVDTMIGKSESLSVMNKLLMERARLTSKIMNQYHVNKLDAMESADKQLNGNQIRAQIHDKLNPRPTDEDINFMADKYKVSPDEIKKRLKDKGLL